MQPGLYQEILSNLAKNCLIEYPTPTNQLLNVYLRNPNYEPPELEHLLTMSETEFKKLPLNKEVEDPNDINHGMNLFWIAVRIASKNGMQREIHLTKRGKLLQRILELHPMTERHNINFTAAPKNSANPECGLTAFSLSIQTEDSELYDTLLALPDPQFEALNFNDASGRTFAYEKESIIWALCTKRMSTASKILNRVFSLPEDRLRKIDISATPKVLPGTDPTTAARAAGVYHLVKTVEVSPFQMACLYSADKELSFYRRIHPFLSLPKGLIQTLGFENDTSALVTSLSRYLHDEPDTSPVLFFLCNIPKQILDKLPYVLSREPGKLLSLVKKLRELLDSQPISTINEKAVTEKHALISKTIKCIQQAGSSVYMDYYGVTNAAYFLLANYLMENHHNTQPQLLEVISPVSPELFLKASRLLANYYYTFSAEDYAPVSTETGMELPPISQYLPTLIREVYAFQKSETESQSGMSPFQRRLSDLEKAMQRALFVYFTDHDEYFLRLMVRITQSFWSTQENIIGKSSDLREPIKQAPTTLELHISKAKTDIQNKLEQAEHEFDRPTILREGTEKAITDIMVWIKAQRANFCTPNPVTAALCHLNISTEHNEGSAGPANDHTTESRTEHNPLIPN